MVDLRDLRGPVDEVPAADEHRYAAATTERQIRSLARHAEATHSIEALRSLAIDGKNQMSKAADPRMIRGLLFNGWGTEYLLRSGPAALGSAVNVGVQWAFPQAYYACFSLLQAYLQASGCPAGTHASLQSTFSNMARKEKVPASIGAYALGCGKSGAPGISVHRITLPATPLPQLAFDERNDETWRAHVVRLLTTTRERRIDKARKKKAKMFRTKNGHPKKSLSSKEWTRLSETVPATTVLDYLYRKRIKSNYEDVEVFTSESLDGERVFDALVTFVGVFAEVLEALLHRRAARVLQEAREAYLLRRTFDELRARGVVIRDHFS